uniref:Uncharacterized protein n=1 Tax=viral metagenome TaxID=1070528 RepID=A0A6C0KY03_9ZZZZ
MKYIFNLLAVSGDVLKIGPDKAVATLQGTERHSTGFGCDLTEEMAADMLKFDKEDWEFWNNITKPRALGKIAKHISVWINPSPGLHCASIIFYDERYLQIICSVFNKTKEEILTTLTIFDELKSSPKMDLVSIAFGEQCVELTEDGKKKYKMYKEAAAALSD